VSLNKNLTLRSKRIKLGITLGDPSGIGPEVIAKALNNPSINELADFFVIGDSWVLDKFNFPNRKIKIVDLNNVRRKNFAFGKLKAEYGRASLDYIDQALKMITDRKIDCMVTAPVSKEAINSSGLKFRGHTEYLAYRSDTDNFVMMLVNKYIRTSLVTRHISLKEVPSKLNKDIIYKTIMITHDGLKSWFNIKRPRLIVCGVNPHASDGGIIGLDEKISVSPAVNKARKTIDSVIGPVSADSAFLKMVKGNFDCTICMYHDQALIPLKVTDSPSGVNITLGLSFIRTSPLHGTAFDIANTNSADPRSMIEAIRLAIFCTQNYKKTIGESSG
jgi:4-hydroxythreonine-4-phosphate dehydrogenase